MRENASVATLRLLLAQLAIGAAAIFARLALGGSGPVAASALRLAIAAVPLVVVAYLTRSRSPALGLRREAIFAVAGLLLALHFAAWLASLEWTSVAISTLLVCTTPLWTELAEAIARARMPRRTALLAFALAIAGIVPIALERSTPAPFPGHALDGDALALVGSFAIGGYLLLVRRFAAAPRSGDTVPTAQVVARTYAWAACFLAIASLAVHDHAPAFGDARAWLGIAAMALVSQLLGHTLLNAALRRFPPSLVAMTTLLEPVIAALLAALLFGERLSPATLAGGLAVLAAVTLALRDHAASETELAAIP